MFDNVPLNSNQVKQSNRCMKPGLSLTCHASCLPLIQLSMPGGSKTTTDIGKIWIALLTTIMTAWKILHCKCNSSLPNLPKVSRWDWPITLSDPMAVTPPSKPPRLEFLPRHPPRRANPQTVVFFPFRSNPFYRPQSQNPIQSLPAGMVHYHAMQIYTMT